VLDPRQANHLAVTLDREPSFVVGDALPPAWHWLYFHDLVPASGLGADGHARLGGQMPPSDLTRRMWAAGRIDMMSTLRLGANATRTSTIRSVVPKEGRSGRLLFVTIDHAVHVDDTTVVLEEQTIVYRDPSAPAAGEAPMAPSDAEFSDAWQLDSVALFRYSALTFNSHRIHYDGEYARDVEGYPGLVVHGPLLATLLLDSASRRGLTVETVRYRAVSPVFLPDGFTVSGRQGDVALSLWATSATGQLAMQATATTRQEIDR
jgi:3-methylfumaryl-CoA hydratase